MLGSGPRFRHQRSFLLQQTTSGGSPLHVTQEEGEVSAIPVLEFGRGALR